MAVKTRKRIVFKISAAMIKKKNVYLYGRMEKQILIIIISNILTLEIYRITMID